MPASPTDETFDAIVVGSGPNGGMAAMALSEAGLRVLVLEAGPLLDARRVYGSALSHHVKRLYRLGVSKRQATQSIHSGYWEGSPDLWADDGDNPYTAPADKPFHWIRGRQVGGRSLTWGGMTLRMSDLEFKAASHDGFGEDWPIAQADLAPYYDEIERFFDVRGTSENLAGLPAGTYREPLPLTPPERHFKSRVEASWPERAVISARGITASRDHRWSREAPWPAHSSLATSLAAALGTGRTILRPNAVVSHVIADTGGRAVRGVGYVDAATGRSREIFAGLVVLSASTIETLRILLHSRQAGQAKGLADQSGWLGRGIMDHAAVGMPIHFPDVAPSKDTYPLLGCTGLLIPRFRNLGRDDGRGFLRGYGLWCHINRGPAAPRALQKQRNGALGIIVAYGEMLSRRENFVRLDETVKDRWGIPAAHIHCAWTENELRMAADMESEIGAMLDQAGGRPCSILDVVRMPFVGGLVRRIEASVRLSTPGLFVHELGGARMGSSPETSIVNAWNQVWELPNLLVTDGACWVSSGWQNPTLTQMAITLRACRAAASAGRRGEAHTLRS